MMIDAYIFGESVLMANPAVRMSSSVVAEFHLTCRGAWFQPDERSGQLGSTIFKKQTAADTKPLRQFPDMLFGKISRAR